MGVSRHRVAFLLGRPTDWLAGQNPRDSLVWVFGSVEMGFDPSFRRLIWMQLERLNHRRRFEGCRTLMLSHDGFDPAADAAAFQRFARKNGIPLLAVAPPWRSQGEVCFAGPGGVVAWFATDTESGMTSFDTLITEDLSRFRVDRRPVSLVRLWDTRRALRSGRTP